MWMVWKQEENCWVYVLWQGGRKREKQMVLERLFIRGVKLPAARMKHFAKNELNPLIASFIFTCFLRFSTRFTEGIMQIRRWRKNMCRIARFWDLQQCVVFLSLNTVACVYFSCFYTKWLTLCSLGIKPMTLVSNHLYLYSTSYNTDSVARSTFWAVSAF